ncbi:MAG: hypothetical protein ACR2PZ_15170 [Pseudomonadales bacterium]
MRRLSLIAALMCLISIVGCGGPVFFLPAGELAGTVSTDQIDDWSFLTETFMDLETNADKPYSVVLNYIVRDGNLYIDPEEGKTWFKYLRQNLEVRVRFGDTIYPVQAVLVGKPGELEGFDASRFIYRLDSR